MGHNDFLEPMLISIMRINMGHKKFQSTLNCPVGISVGRSDIWPWYAYYLKFDQWYLTHTRNPNLIHITHTHTCIHLIECQEKDCIMVITPTVVVMLLVYKWEFLGTIGWDPSVSKSNWLYVDIFFQFFLHQIEVYFLKSYQTMSDNSEVLNFNRLLFIWN